MSNFACELRELANQSEYVENGLNRIKDLLRSKARVGVYEVKINHNEVAQTIRKCNSVTFCSIEAILQRLRDEGVFVDISYGSQPGESNYVTFSWAD